VIRVEPFREGFFGFEELDRKVELRWCFQFRHTAISRIEVPSIIALRPWGTAMARMTRKLLDKS
jgi:hypothetical protein